MASPKNLAGRTKDEAEELTGKARESLTAAKDGVEGFAKSTVKETGNIVKGGVNIGASAVDGTAKVVDGTLGLVNTGAQSAKEAAAKFIDY